MSSDDISDKTTAQHHPINADGDPITWNQNDAAILGTLDTFFETCERTRDFVLLFKHNASLKRGVIYMDSVEAVSFILGTAKDPTAPTYGYSEPSPPTPSKIAPYNAARIISRAAGGRVMPALDAAIPDAFKRTHVVNPHEVDLERGRLLDVLASVFKGTIWTSKAIKAA